MATLQRGSIVLAPILTSDGARQENHPAVVLTLTEAIQDSEALFGVMISGSTDFAPPELQVRLPFANPGVTSKTGLTKPCVAYCDRIVEIKKDEIIRLVGHVPDREFFMILKLLETQRP